MSRFSPILFTLTLTWCPEALREFWHKIWHASCTALPECRKVGVFFSLHAYSQHLWSAFAGSTIATALPITRVHRGWPEPGLLCGTRWSWCLASLGNVNPKSRMNYISLLMRNFDVPVWCKVRCIRGGLWSPVSRPWDIISSITEGSASEFMSSETDAFPSAFSYVFSK